MTWTRPARTTATVIATLALAGTGAAAPSLETALTGDSAGSRDPRPATTAADDLAADLDAIIADGGDADGQTGLVVRAADGTELYHRDPTDRLLPASNAKLFTAAAALEVLGEDHRFTTDVHAAGVRRGRQLVGDLYLRGGGDPTLLADDYDALAAEVADAGVGVVAGDLVADDTWFDDVRLGFSWAWDDEPYYYSSQISALTVSPDEDYDAGTVIVEVTPGASAGAPARVDVVPDTGYVDVVDDIETTADGDTSIDVTRRHGTNEIVVSGSIPVGADADRSWASVWEPTGYAADVFRRALRDHGIRVLGDVRLGESTPDDAEQVASHVSMTLGELLVPFMKLSNNNHAEVLTKQMGRVAADEGSWDAGTEVRDEALATLGLDPGEYVLNDGSGLSRMDWVAPDQVATLLVASRQQPWFDAFEHSLPVAGHPDRMVGGTLSSRMVDTAAEGDVRAKTGSLTSVTGLSGYVTDADGEELVFSMLQNNFLDIDGKALEDRVAVRLAEFSRDAAARTPLSRSPADRPVPTADLPADVECSWVKAC